MNHSLSFNNIINDLNELAERQTKAINQINSIYKVDGKIVGTGQADYTQKATEYDLENKKKKFCLIDIPGIEGNEKKFKKIIQNALDKAHVIIYVAGTDKKIEPETIKKIKQYLKNDTEVYFVCNVHCMPEANRTEGSYSQELKDVYKEAASKVFMQSEKELKEILGENYKNGMLINGLLGLTSVAYKGKESTLIPDDVKMLHKNQSKFKKEYESDIPLMKKESHIDELNNIIKSHTENYQENIYKSNTRKFVSCLNKASTEIDIIEKETGNTIKSLIEPYDTFITACDEAKEEYDRDIDSFVHDTVEIVINNEIKQICDLIDEKKGKVKQKELEAHFESRNKVLRNYLLNELTRNLQSIENQKNEQLKEAFERFSKDIEVFKNIKITHENFFDGFDISSIVNEITKSLKYNLKFLGNDLLKVGSFAMDGAGIGGLIGGLIGTAPGAVIGGIIGGIIGGLAGIGTVILKFFQTKDKRIAEAKKNAERQMWQLSTKITNELEEKIDLQNIKMQGEKNIYELKDQVNMQKNQVNKIRLLISKINKEIKRRKEEYGKL